MPTPIRNKQRAGRRALALKAREMLKVEQTLSQIANRLNTSRTTLYKAIGELENEETEDLLK